MSKHTTTEKHSFHYNAFSLFQSVLSRCSVPIAYMMLSRGVDAQRHVVAISSHYHGSLRQRRWTLVLPRVLATHAASRRRLVSRC
eukprot:COSAG03_NODE_126_length_12149_cov_3.594274_8_plen_85_part_00